MPPRPATIVSLTGRNANVLVYEHPAFVAALLLVAAVAVAVVTRRGKPGKAASADTATPLPQGAGVSTHEC